MADTMSVLNNTVERHRERMAAEALYRDRVTHFEALNEAWKRDAEARKSYYDVDGYCDNPGRGF